MDYRKKFKDDGQRNNNFEGRKNDGERREDASQGRPSWRSNIGRGSQSDNGYRRDDDADSRKRQFSRNGEDGRSERSFGSRGDNDRRSGGAPRRSNGEESRSRFGRNDNKSGERSSNYGERRSDGNDRRGFGARPERRAGSNDGRRFETKRNNSNDSKPFVRTNHSENPYERKRAPRPDLFDNEQEDAVVKQIAEHLASEETRSTKMRLNRYIANSGVCSRRDADVLIQNGKITVNDKVVTQMGVVVNEGDVIKYEGRILTSEKKIYVLLNKPKGVVTTTDDPEERRTVMDLVSEACAERIYPVGRLDRNTTGVLLLTNDGELASKLMHPKFECRKIYHVFTDKVIHEADMTQMIEGVTLEDGPIAVDDVRYVTPDDKKQVGVEIHSGRNRIVRRIFEHLKFDVEKLDRVYFAGLTKLNLPRGQWRFLSVAEVNRLKAGFFK